MQDTDSTRQENRPEDNSEMEVTSSQLLRIARGFTTIFWGLPLGVLLFFNAIQIRIGGQIPLPSYLIGVAFICAGFLWLCAVGPLTPLWQRYRRRFALVLFLHVYFAPFVIWWQHQPQTSYYMVNVIGLLFCAMWNLFLINRLAGEIGRILRDTALHAESEICGLLVILLLVAPVLLFVSVSCVSACRHDTNLRMELLFRLEHIPTWILAFPLLPLSLTMAIVWKVKRLCVRKLTAGGHG